MEQPAEIAKNSAERDSEIIASVLGGNRDAFRELVLIHQLSVYSIIMRQVGDRSIADDLTQETFLKAYTKLSSFRSESRFSTWLVRIALNTTKNYFSSRAYKQRRANMEINETQIPAASEGNIEAWTEERLTQLRSRISELPEKFRETLVLVGLEGKSYDEAALILSIPVGTVRSRLNTARNILRKNIHEVSNI